MYPFAGNPAVHDAGEVAIGFNTPISTNVIAMFAATAVEAQAAPTSTPSMSTAASIYDDSSQGDCELLGPFALIVQAALGALALLSLVYKRWRERPQRPLKVWFFDVSKQVFGSVLVHIANIFMSMLTSGRFSVQVEPNATTRLAARSDDDDYVPNPCSFYLLNLAIDTTLGIPILIILLKVTTGLVAFTPFGKPVESIQSGNYGSPPRANWWFKQSVIYFFGLFGMKICVLIIFLMMPWISKVGDWALSWTEGNERLQIAFVMMIFPLIMNGIQYYIIDSFIKKKDNDYDHDHERLPSEDPDEVRRRYDDSEEEELENTSPHRSGNESDGDGETAAIKGSKRPQSRDSEYDPDLDGDAPTIIGSTTSGLDRSKVAPAELLPKE